MFSPVGMNLMGLEGATRYAPGRPTVELVFRDGSRETVLEDGEAFVHSEHYALSSDFHGWRDGTVHVSLCFGQALNYEEIAEVVVDGQTFYFDR